jgi:hypothetical protein
MKLNVVFEDIFIETKKSFSKKLYKIIALIDKKLLFQKNKFIPRSYLRRYKILNF